MATMVSLSLASSGMPIQAAGYGELSERGERVVAFDVFDTLVARTVNPEHVKRLSLDLLRRRLTLDGIDSETLYAFRHRIEAELCQQAASQVRELEFRFQEMGVRLYDELRQRGIDLHGLSADAFAAELLDCELAVERNVLHAIPEAQAAIRDLLAAGRTVVLISDFYLPASALARLLDYFGFGAATGRLYVSCDHMASKRSGRLYAHVLAELRAELGVLPGDVVMVGDNPHSDGAMALQHGMSSVHVDDPHKKAFYQSADASVTNLTAARRALNDVLSGAEIGHHARFVAPVLVLFIERIYRQARRHGWRHLFFLAREGQPLQAMFERYQDALGLQGDRRIQSHYLKVSRRATFVAALAPLDEERFDGLFAMYRQISIRDFMRSLRIDDSVIDEIGRELSVDPDQRLSDFPSSDTLARLLALPRFRALYEEIRQAQRGLLERYVEGFGVPLDRHPLVLIDVGWKGTIQDFLASALPQADVHGLYLGLLSIGQSLRQKSGLLFSDVDGCKRGHLIYTENRSLFEIVLCADHGSALNYIDDGNGRVEVELDEDHEELSFIRRAVIPLRDDLLTAFGDICVLRSRFVLDEAWFERFATDSLASAVFRPWLPACGWLAAAQHRENFGVFSSSKFSNADSVTIIDRLRYLYRAMRYRRRFLMATFWPAHTIYCHLGRGAAAFYGGYRKIRDRRLPPMCLKD